MIPWHVPELRTARAELLSNMAALTAREDERFQRFMLAAMAKPARKRQRR